MIILRIKICLLFFLLVSCSAVEKSLFLKPIDKNTNWKMIKNKNYLNYFPLKTPWQDWSTHQYFSCDSTSSLSINFSNDPQYILVGPPFLAIFPTLPIFNYTWNRRKKYYDQELYAFNFTIKINIKTLDYNEIDSLINYVHFYFNESLNFIPSNIQIIKNTTNKDFLYDGIFCNKSQTNSYYSVLFKFRKKTFNLKKIVIEFDDKFNVRLKSNYKKLELKRRNKYYYCPFCDYQWL